MKVQDPVVESQTKTKLGSQAIEQGGPSIRSWVVDFLRKHIDNYLHQHTAAADAIQKNPTIRART